jgi:AcrR family transcriptional regulator
MARPVNADSAATRRRIRENAVTLFARHGVDGVSVRTIANEAGVSLAMVHHYFGSKNGLYRACIDAMYDTLAEMRPRLAAAVTESDAATSPAALIERIVREAFRFARERQVTVRLVQRSIMEAGELDSKHRENVQLPFLSEMSQLVGALLARDPAVVRLQLQSMSALITRYAVSTEAELSHMTQLDDPVAAAAAIEDHLVHAAHALLGMTTPHPE